MEGRSLTEADFGAIDVRVAAIVKEKQPFERAVVTRDEALSMFAENKFKLEIIGGLPEEATVTLLLQVYIINVRKPWVPTMIDKRLHTRL